MDRRDLDEIERFLTLVGRPSLFAYYGVDPGAPLDELDGVVKKRRTWAQGQQSNPKYKSEALFLIKSNALLRRIFLDQLDAYREHVQDDTAGRNLDVLALFIRGTLSSGVLTHQSEAAIRHQGHQLELADAAVTRLLEEMLEETGARRPDIGNDDVTAEATAIDHYAILGVATNAQPSAIEEAYRSRYRWARSLKDLKRSADVLQALDDAWRMLSDPKRRIRYDERRLEMLEVTDEVEKRAAALIGLLGGPQDAITGEAPLPGAPPSPVHEVGFRAATLPPGAAPKIQARSTTNPPVMRSAPPVLTPPPTIRLADADSSNGVGLRAPSPPTVSGRTIGLAQGPQTVATLGPRLGVDGPDVLSVKVGGRDVTRTLVVRNIGQGRMPGRVTSDRHWLKIAQARLDPTAAEQRVLVTVVPKEMPWGRTAGTVTVVTDHGERRTLTLQATRTSVLPWIAGVGAVMVLGIAVAGAGFAWMQRADSMRTMLLLTIDPVADRVFVDGKDLGRGTRLEIAEPRAGVPFQLRVEADGFEPREEIVTLRSGEQTTRTIRLSLAEGPRWTPAPDGQPAVADPTLIAALQTATAGLTPCFEGTGIATAEASYTAWVTGDGQVRRADLAEANFPSDATEPCIQHVFRGIRLPGFAGDYVTIEGRLSIPVAP